MANKTPTITKPVAADVNRIMLDVNAGAVTRIVTSLEVQTSDPKVGYVSGSASTITVPADHPAKVQTELTALVASVVALHNTAEGF